MVAATKNTPKKSSKNKSRTVKPPSNPGKNGLGTIADVAPASMKPPLALVKGILDDAVKNPGGTVKHGFSFPADDKQVPPPEVEGGKAKPAKKPSTKLGRQIDFNVKELQRIEGWLEGDAAAIRGMTTEALMEKLQHIAIEDEWNDMKKKNDPKLIDAKDEVKKHSEFYNETARGLKKRKRFIVSVLQERGAL